MTFAKTASLKTNPNNPRSIRKDKLDKLVESLKQFPEMLEARPIVVDKDGVVSILSPGPLLNDLSSDAALKNPLKGLMLSGCSCY